VTKGTPLRKPYPRGHGKEIRKEASSKDSKRLGTKRTRSNEREKEQIKIQNRLDKGTKRISTEEI